MSHEIMPTPDNVAEYISARYDQRTAAKIEQCLSSFSDAHGERLGYLQAAVITSWEAEVKKLSATNEEYIFRSLQSKIRTINNDPRDFLRSFEPPIGWEDRFR